MISLKVPTIGGSALDVHVEKSRALYVLGANGTGKSTLLFRWAQSQKSLSLIAGNRDIIFDQPTISLTAQQAMQQGKSAIGNYRQPEARAKRSSHNNAGWLSALLFNLKARQDYGNEQYVEADLAGHDDLKAELIKKIPLKLVNEAFAASSVPITFSWKRDATLRVKKNDSNYDFNQMSDGERAAFILVSHAILADDGDAILVDEPERHLHRSISAPLLSHLRELREDVYWVIATHDLTLPRTDPASDALLLYEFENQNWRAELVPEVWQLNATISEAVYGARDRVIFVEGEIGSLDLPLYSSLYRGVTVVPSGSCKDVVNATTGLEGVPALHTMTARGLVDRDNQPNVDSLIAKGVHPLDFYSVESLYYHPNTIEVIRVVAGTERSLEEILQAACRSISDSDLERLSLDAAYKSFAVRFQSMIPDFDTFRDACGAISVEIDPSEIVAEKRAEFERARADSNWLDIIRLFKIRSTSCPGRIAGLMGFSGMGAYELSVRKRLIQDDDFRNATAGLVPQPF